MTHLVGLSNTQRRFARCITTLLVYIHQEGYEVTFGDFNRSIQEATRRGFSNSNHTRRLAADLNLFKDGIYLTTTEDHRKFGEFWEGLDPLARWGGRFNDGNHYSFEWQGVK